MPTIRSMRLDLTLQQVGGLPIRACIGEDYKRVGEDYSYVHPQSGRMSTETRQGPIADVQPSRCQENPSPDTDLVDDDKTSTQPHP